MSNSLHSAISERSFFGSTHGCVRSGGVKWLTPVLEFESVELLESQLVRVCGVLLEPMQFRGTGGFDNDADASPLRPGCRVNPAILTTGKCHYKTKTYRDPRRLPAPHLRFAPAAGTVPRRVSRRSGMNIMQARVIEKKPPPRTPEL